MFCDATDVCAQMYEEDNESLKVSVCLDAIENIDKKICMLTIKRNDLREDLDNLDRVWLLCPFLFLLLVVAVVLFPNALMVGSLFIACCAMCELYWHIIEKKHHAISLVDIAISNLIKRKHIEIDNIAGMKAED